MAKFVVEKRKYTRHDYPSVIEYCLKEDSDKKYKGVMINISNSGLCLYIFNFIREGREIVINTSLPFSKNTASVRWIKEISKGIYQAGLTFVE